MRKLNKKFFSYANEKVVNITLIRGDFFENYKWMTNLPVDAIITDFPNGPTPGVKNKSTIEFKDFWEIFFKIRRDESSPMITTSKQPYTTKLISSNPEDFKQHLVWVKDESNDENDKKEPIKLHEDIVVFGGDGLIFNPQMIIIKKPILDDNRTIDGEKIDVPENIEVKETIETMFPNSVLKIDCEKNIDKICPTQKPVALYEWLIKSYTNEGDVILDPFFGSGAVAIACLKTNRNFIGFEVNKNYFNKTFKRIKNLSKEDWYNEWFKKL